MRKDKRVSREISDVSWCQFIHMLEYKALWYGNTIIKVPRYYASSQTCSKCGYKYPKVRDLSVREWICPECNTHHDRDINAAVNILNKGLSMIENQ